MNVTDLIIARAMEKVASMEKEAAVLPFKLLAKSMKTFSPWVKASMKATKAKATKAADILADLRAPGGWSKYKNPKLLEKRLRQVQRGARHRLAKLEDLKQWSGDVKISNTARNNPQIQKLYTHSINKGITPFQSSVNNWDATPIDQIMNRIRYNY